jgi:zinc protease
LDEELEMAKAYLTGSFVFNFETNAQMASFLVEAETHKLGFDFLERYPDLIRAVTKDDVLRVSQANLDPKNMTTVMVGPIKS